MVAPAQARQRHYLCQNWRADVSAILTGAGSMVEWIKYSAYGVPMALPAGDTDSDGDWDSTDAGNINGAYDVRKDTNLDGVVSAADVTHANDVSDGYRSLGRGVLSSPKVANRRGFAGYEFDPTFAGASGGGRRIYHVRHRVYDADIGRWTRRDPLGYVDGMSLYEYVKSGSVVGVDPMGLRRTRSAQDSQPTPIGNWIPPTGMPTCGTASDYAKIQAEIASVTAACPLVKLAWTFDPSCPSGSGFTVPVKGRGIEITICTGPSSSGSVTPQDCSRQMQAILHELTHAQQACTVYGLCTTRWSKFLSEWNSEPNAICREVDAYCKENPRLCPGGVPSRNSRRSLCLKACDSVIPDDFLFDWLRERRLAQCLNDCLSYSPNCKGGIYKLPPVAPPPDSRPDPKRPMW